MTPSMTRATNGLMRSACLRRARTLLQAAQELTVEMHQIARSFPDSHKGSNEMLQRFRCGGPE